MKQVSTRLFNGALSVHILKLVVYLAAATLCLALVTLLLGDALYAANALLFNVVLAIIPFPFAALLAGRWNRAKRGPLAAVWWVMWLAFWPNAPYVMTDLIHIGHYSFNGGFDAAPTGLPWLGLAHIALVVALGLGWGMLGLYLLHTGIRRRHGAGTGWLFVAAASLLGGAGMYIGRFMRFNTWDLLQRPLVLLRELAARLEWRTPLFVLLFAAMAMGVYTLFYLCLGAGEVGGQQPCGRSGEKPANTRP